MKCKIKILDEVYAAITGLNQTTINILWDKFGPFVDGYRFMPAFKLGRWDGRIRFFEKTGKTYVNLLFDIVPILEQIGYEIDLIDNREYFDSPGPITNDIFAEHDIFLRDHQVLAVNNLLEAKGGFGILPTGFGKSLLTAALSHVYNEMDYNVITIVPSTDLVEQTYKWYKRCGIDTGKYCGAEKDIHHMSVVSTWQSLQNNPRILEKFRCIIWDEVHGAKAQVARDLLTIHAKHAPFKYGVTGTFPKSLTDQLCLHASVGGIVTSLSARWLMDNGYLTPVEIEAYEIKEANKEEFPDYASERSYLTKNKDRLELIADLVINRCEKYGNTLVLVSSIQFGERLAELIDGAVFLYGGTDTDTRREHYDLFETETNLIRIATFGIASTGISIDRIMCLMMIDSGKSYIQCIQTIGRSLRQADGKMIAYVCDVYSNLKWSLKHWKERKKHYKEAEYPIISEHKLKVK